MKVATELVVLVPPRRPIERQGADFAADPAGATGLASALLSVVAGSALTSN